MALTDFLPLAVFALVGTVTPGPNNVMLMASGANFGFHRTIPHMLGIGFGLASMILSMGLGLGQVFDALPASQIVLKVLAVAYLLWLAWAVANAAPQHDASSEGRPMTLLQGAAFQWVNPKAWAMALSVTTVYLQDTTLEALSLAALIFMMVGLPSVALWTALGQRIARVLRSPDHLRCFNWSMAGLLVLSLYPILTH